MVLPTLYISKLFLVSYNVSGRMSTFYLSALLKEEKREVRSGCEDPMERLPDDTCEGDSQPLDAIGRSLSL